MHGPKSKSQIELQSVYIEFTELGYRQTRPQKQALKIIISLSQLYIISVETTFLRVDLPGFDSPQFD